MAYSSNIYRQAMEKKQNMKHHAEYLYNSNLETALEKHKDLHKINNQINMLSSRLMGYILSGNDNNAERTESTIKMLSKEKDELLKKYNIAVSPNYSCKICLDSGVVDSKYCKCVENLARDIVFRRMDIRMPLTESTFESFNLMLYSDIHEVNGLTSKDVMSTNFQICKDFANDFPNVKNLLLMGNTGTGKTHLSLAIANSVINKGYSVFYAPVQRITDGILNEKFGREESGITDAVMNSDLLIIDDLGSEVINAAGIAVVNDIINSRLLSSSPTIISTNLSLKAIETKYSERINSRIIGNYIKCFFIGNDIRQLKGTDL